MSSRLVLGLTIVSLVLWWVLRRGRSPSPRVDVPPEPSPPRPPRSPQVDRHVRPTSASSAPSPVRASRPVATVSAPVTPRQREAPMEEMLGPRTMRPA